jgi:hypothetical protein
MKTTLLFANLLFLVACSGTSATPPVISHFAMQSPVSTTASSISGSVDISDPGGLSDLSANFTIHGAGLDTSFSASVSGSAGNETAQTLPLLVELASAIPAGSYEVSITLTEGGATSNALTTTVVVQ